MLFRKDALVLLIAGVVFVLSCRTATSEETVQFGEQILPILSRSCFACHGLDEGTREADLRLDIDRDALASGAIKPGKPEESELIARITSNDADTVMPPPDADVPLSDDEKELLRQWITEGAKYEKHWAFVPPLKRELPVNQDDWSQHPIDRFVLARLEEKGLKPNEREEAARLLRRLYLDVIGLPPTFEEVSAFLQDDSEQAYERVVDQLLQRDAFGEHWARLWLDLARYADTKGYEKDRARTIWRYRDWVIDAFNQDLPYDQFTIEQLAGDLLPNPSIEQILATAFHRNTMENEEGGTDDEEFRVAAVKDRVDTTVQVWMGLTMGCAKCHSHKYDPISHEDYYAFYDFFNQTEDADREAPVMPTPSREQRLQLEQLETELRAVQERLSNATETIGDAIVDWKKQFVKEPLWQRLALLEFESQAGVSLKTVEGRDLMVDGELPDKDVWTLTFELVPGTPLNSIRLDVLPKVPGGKWNDKNVVISELTVEIVQEGREAIPLKLVQPRADFSQRGWEVAQAIDGNPDLGWAFSPKASEAHCAIFDFAEPLVPKEGQLLRLTVEQRYGQGLVLDRFRFSASSYPTDWLLAEVDFETKLDELYVRRVHAETVELFSELDALRRNVEEAKKEFVSTPIMRELPAEKRRVTRVHLRGNFLEQGSEVEGRTLSAFDALDEELPRSRLGVAYWLVDPGNPLTARVAVNRLWAQLFGTGLVETEEDFGTQGAFPSHPELLDWLAVDFMEQGWSQKRLIKTIVTSKTYQQSAAATIEKMEADPQNRLLSRGPRFRLSAEMVRDQALAVSGLLTHRVGGPSVMPPQPDGIWKSTYSGEQWKNATGADRYRRALYTYKKRTSPYPAMMTFDSGSGEVCQIRRVRTNTPLQALVTLNDTVYIEAAGALALRMEEASSDLPERLSFGFQRVLLRSPDSEELERLVQLYKALQAEITDGEKLLKASGRTGGDAVLVAVANVILNLDEAMTKP